MPRRTDRAIERRAAARTATRRRVGRAADAALVLAAIAGVVCAGWWVLCGVFGFGLVTFATGSMAPSYPTGSVAVSRSEPVRSIRVGDVVTVDRGRGLLPITHRVKQVRFDGATAHLVLQGDANSSPDPHPYAVRAIREVVLPLPLAADVLRLGSSPVGVGAVTALLAFVVVRALWPDPEVDGERYA